MMNIRIKTSNSFVVIIEGRFVRLPSTVNIAQTVVSPGIVRGQRDDPLVGGNGLFITSGGTVDIAKAVPRGYTIRVQFHSLLESR